MQYKNESIFTKEQKEKIWNMATSKLIRISENKNWIVDYDKERGIYRVSYFQDNHFKDECWFDAYEEKEINEDYMD